MAEIKIIVDKDGTSKMTLQGFEAESQKIAQEFELSLGNKPTTVNWQPKLHLNQTVKAG